MNEHLLNVDLGDRSYPIYVVPGGLDDLGEVMLRHLDAGPCVIVTNPVVGALYGYAAAYSLQNAGFAPSLVYLPDGEEHKTLETYATLVGDLLSVGVDRQTPVIALGGGVTGDIAGFVAATVLRGIPLVQVPTTLLAMVDSSVGGKTGVNTRHGKNLVGAFHQPRLVFAPSQVLATLDNSEWRCGLGEALKHGVIRDADLFQYMVAHADALARRETAVVTRVVRRCCAIKASVVAEDERETGLRTILNFGHTVGHAIENAFGYGALRHGEAVGIGMIAEARYAESRGWCDEGMADVIGEALARLGLPTSAPIAENKHPDRLRAVLLDAAQMDKKSVHGTLTLVVPVRIGEVELRKIPMEDLPDLLRCLDPAE